MPHRRRPISFAAYRTAAAAVAAAACLTLGRAALAQMPQPVEPDELKVPPAELQATDAALRRSESFGGFSSAVTGMVDMPRTPASLQSLLPTEVAGHGNPGLLIFEPAAAPDVDAETTAFAAGCGEWLQFEVGGLPQMGQTPSYDSVARAKIEAGFAPERRLRLLEARVIARLTGATHVAVGSIRASGPSLTLTYAVYDAGTGRPVGAPVTAAGNAAALRAALPRMAGGIASLLGVAFPAGTAAPDLSVAELAALGRMETTDAPAASDVGAMAAEAGRSALATLAVIGDRDISTYATAAQWANRLLTRLAPKNGLAWDRVATNGATLIVPLGAPLTALRHAYPRVVTLATADRCYQIVAGTPAGQHRALQDALLAAPRNPDAWYYLAVTYSQDGERLRYARTMDQISASELARLMDMYARWERADQKATTLDPVHAHAWEDLLVATTFSGDESQRTVAVGKAETVSPFLYQTYDWELEMYQDKWGGSTADLDKAADRAAAAHYRDMQTAALIATDLLNLIYRDQTHEIMVRYQAAADYRVGQDPDDWHALWNRAMMLNYLGKHDESEDVYRQIARMRPDDARPLFQLGHDQQNIGEIAPSAESFDHALRVDPEYPEAAAYLACQCASLHRDDDAIRWGRIAVRQMPNDGYAYYSLGVAYNDCVPRRAVEALQAFRRAADVGYGQPGVMQWIAFEQKALRSQSSVGALTR